MNTCQELINASSASSANLGQHGPRGSKAARGVPWRVSACTGERLARMGLARAVGALVSKVPCAPEGVVGFGLATGRRQELGPLDACFGRLVRPAVQGEQVDRARVCVGGADQLPGCGEAFGERPHGFALFSAVVVA